jgi:hypothetical protein
MAIVNTVIATLWHNPFLFAAVLGALFLFYWWFRYTHRTFWGFRVTCVGSTIVLLLGLFWNKLQILEDLARTLSVAVLPVVFALLFIFLVATVLILMMSRRHAAKERASASLPFPREMKCALCKQRGYLHDYEVPSGRHGRMIRRMCNDCAAKQGAKMVRF